MNKPKSTPRPPAPPVYRPSSPQPPTQGQAQPKVLQKTPLVPPPVYRPNPVTPTRVAPVLKQSLTPSRVHSPGPIQQKPAPLRPWQAKFPAPHLRPLVVQRSASDSKEPLVAGVGVVDIAKAGKSVWDECGELIGSIKADLTSLSKLSKEHKSTASKVTGIVKEATGLADKITHLFPPLKVVTTPASYAAKILDAASKIRDLVNLLGKNPIEGAPLLLVHHLQELHDKVQTEAYGIGGLQSDSKVLQVLDDMQTGIEKVQGWMDKAGAS